MLKAVAFDLWETLITNSPEVSRRQTDLRIARLEETLRAHGFAALAERIERAHNALWHRCQELYWSKDLDVPCRRQVEHFLEDVGIDAASLDEPALAELERAYANVAVDILPEPVGGAPELLEALKARELGVGLISNTGRTPGYALREVLGSLGLARCIDVMVFSNEHGHCKPRPSIFEALRRGLGVAYEELMFVGDNLYVDVHGAQSLGMRAVHFRPPMRGTAIAPSVDHGLEIVPDATITSLSELVSIIDDRR